MLLKFNQYAQVQSFICKTIIIWQLSLIITVMSGQKRNNRDTLGDGKHKKGIFTSMYDGGKSPQKLLESSNEPMPNAFPYIQASQTQHIILDQNQLRWPFQNDQTSHQKQANVYLDPLYHSRGGLNTAAFGLLKPEIKHESSSFNFLNQQAGQMANHVASKPVFFDGSINENTPMHTYQNKSHNHPQFILEGHPVNSNFSSNHNIPIYFHGKNVRDVNFGGGTNYYNTSFESHNPPLKTVVPPQFLDGNIHTVIDGNVKKSYIPQHIYNEIPIYQPENYNYNENEYDQRPEDQNNGQTQQLMLKAYQQLFQKFNQQKGKNAGLDRRVIELQAIILGLQTQLNTRQKQNHNQQPKIRHRKKTLDKKVLQQILKLKIQYSVGEVINRRKNNALNRLRDLFSSSYSTISSFQQHTQSKR